MISSRTTSSFVALLSGPLVGTLMEASCFATSGIMCQLFLAVLWGCTRTIGSYCLLCLCLFAGG